MANSLAGVTVEMVRAQYGRNMLQLREMLDKARGQAPKKVNGYSVEELEQRVWTFEHFAAGLPLPPGPRAGERNYPLSGARLAKFEADRASGWR